jgi:hypothetical protein
MIQEHKHIPQRRLAELKEHFSVLKNSNTGEYLATDIHPFEFTPHVAHCIQFWVDREMYMEHLIYIAKKHNVPLEGESYTRVVSYVKDEV